MGRYRIEWTPFALQCLDDIYFYILNQAKSATPADKFIRKITERTDILASHPFVGQVEPYLAAADRERRYLVVGSYKVIYSIQADIVLITDVFHTKLNPDKLTERDHND